MKIVADVVVEACGQKDGLSFFSKVCLLSHVAFYFWEPVYLIEFAKVPGGLLNVWPYIKLYSDYSL